LFFQVRSNVEGNSVKVRDKSLVDEGVVIETHGASGRKLEAAGAGFGGCPFAKGAPYDPAENPHF